MTDIVKFDRGKPRATFIRLSDKDKQTILAIARKENLTMSEVIRAFMVVGLNKYIKEGAEI